MSTARLQNGGAIPQLGVSARGNRRALFAGVAVALALVGSTFAAHAHLGLQGPRIAPFVPICATIWCFAEIVTAFLLMSQFYVSGKLSMAILAAGYLVSGLATVPYILTFPSVLSDGPQPLAYAQISIWMWVFWHLAFPVSIAIAHIIDGSLDAKTVHRNAILSTSVATIGTSIALTTVVAIGAYFLRSSLPVLVGSTGHFNALYKGHVVSAVVVVNALSLGIVLFRARRMSPLQTWVAIALLTMTMDGLVNMWAPGRFSMVWYVGKFESLLTSLFVLLMLLFEVAKLYRRLFDVASIDTLTGLRNRRSLNDSLGRVLDDRAISASGVALLVIDVDNFKGYNDRYGHAAGDIALATVADAMDTALVRSGDFAARFGGEEFVIVLPDVLLDEVEAVAERVRKRVASLGILHEGSSTACLTVSIGAAFCSRHQEVGQAALFDFADQALYAAKAAGRNTVIVRHIGQTERARVAPAASGV